MAKPYMEPAMRRKMGAMESPAAPAAPTEETEGGVGDSPTEENDEGGSDSKPTAFLPKELAGDKQYKPGDEIVLTVDAVDPESGEMQVSCSPDEGDPDGNSSPMENFDKSMPEDGEGY
jgi:hypothetical protein